MTRQDVIEQGDFKYIEKFADVTTFLDEDLAGRIPEPKFKEQLKIAKIIIYPVITTLYQGKESVVDGRRRIVNARELVLKDKDERFRLVRVKMFLDIDPDDKATWAIILNEQRSVNDILTWMMVRQLQKEGKWGEIFNLHRLDKARFKKFDILEKLDHPDMWLQAFAEGRITQNTIFAIAKLGGRQSYIEELYKAKEKGKRLTMEDIAEAKQVPVAAAVASMPKLPGMPESQPANPNGNKPLFAAVITSTLEVIAIANTLGDALTAKRTYNGEGCDLYQLIKLG